MNREFERDGHRFHKNDDGTTTIYTKDGKVLRTNLAYAKAKENYKGSLQKKAGFYLETKEIIPTKDDLEQ